MSTKDTKYTLNTQLTDNEKADKQRILSEIIILNPELERETVEAVINLEQQVVKNFALVGEYVDMGLYQAMAQCTDMIDNKEKHTVYSSSTQGAYMREAICQTSINIIGEKGVSMYVAGTQDLPIHATAGRNFTLEGALIKIMGTAPTLGITLTSSANVVIKITEEMWTVNDPSKLIFLIPAGLADGEYTLTVTTQYSGNSVLLKSPRSVLQTIYIGQAPAGGGGDTRNGRP